MDPGVNPTTRHPSAPGALRRLFAALTSRLGLQASDLPSCDPVAAAHWEPDAGAGDGGALPDVVLPRGNAAARAPARDLADAAR